MQIAILRLLHGKWSNPEEYWLIYHEFMMVAYVITTYQSQQNHIFMGYTVNQTLNWQNPPCPALMGKLWCIFWECFQYNTILRQNGLILQTAFSDRFSWMKFITFLSKFHWKLFPMVQLTISHYLNQWYPVYDAYMHKGDIGKLTVLSAFAKLCSPTSANNTILAGVQYIFIHKILPQHQRLCN